MKKAILYLIAAIPLMFLSPMVLSIGFVALRRDDNYIILMLGAVLSLFSMYLVFYAIRLLLRSLD